MTMALCWEPQSACPSAVRPIGTTGDTAALIQHSGIRQS